MIDIFNFKQIGFLTPVLQIIFIGFLFFINFIIQKKEYNKTGKIYGYYPWRIYTFFSSIFEEIIFRGFILFGLLNFLPVIISIIISSFLFGIWHLKNYKWHIKKEVIYQVLYTGFIFGPIMSLITLLTGTVWIAVMIHYVHNLLADLFRKEYT